MQHTRLQWPQTRLTERLGIAYPIIQAPMAGGVTTPELVAAVSNSGGLGSLGVGYLPPEQIQREIEATRQLTDRPFAVNLFVPEPDAAAADQIDAMSQMLQPYRDELGLPETVAPAQYAQLFDAQMTVVLEARVPVVSFTFGIPPAEWLDRLKANDSLVIATATTVAEAQALEQAGVDAIVAQGSEAGGHRGTFLGSAEHALIGTMALVPQMVDAVGVPVIASGGIMDGRGVVAALVLGATAVQMGTAFLSCAESGTHPRHKAALLATPADATALTRMFSGKLARGIRNRFIEEMQPHAEHVPSYPMQNTLTKDIRRAAGQQDRTDLMSLWAGQGLGLSSDKPARVLMDDLVAQAEAIIRPNR